jgi:hypothetical protein
MKRLNAIQSQNLNFLKFFIIALLFVFLAKIGNGIFGGKNNEISKNIPAPPQSGALVVWKG